MNAVPDSPVEHGSPVVSGLPVEHGSPAEHDPLAEAVQRLYEVVTRLRVECPWDREQTHASLAPHALEEAQELATALMAMTDGEPSTGQTSDQDREGRQAHEAREGRQDRREGCTEDLVEDLVEELGDVLLQVFLNAVIGEQSGTFTLTDVFAAIEQKMIRRHPHVFERASGDPELSQEQLAQQWARIKHEERSQRSSRRAF